MRAKITLVVCSILLWSAGNAAAPQQIEERKKSPQEEEMTERRKKEFNKQRHKAMIADAEKLVGLAGEIKESAKPEETESPGSVMSKLENVEKLARRIKNNMQENANITEAKWPAPTRPAAKRGSRSPVWPSGL